MLAGNRSLNLSNSVAVVLYEAWRQLGFRQVGSELNSDPHR
jgi:tRNA(Leu) C34 or U34 (ribose-2'-O)-methylase TrmL